MQGLWKNLFWVAPLLGIVLYYIMSQNQELKQDITVDKVEMSIEKDSFDADFAKMSGEHANTKEDKQYYKNQVKTYSDRANSKIEKKKLEENRQEKLRRKSEKDFNDMEAEAKSYKFDEEKHKKDFEDL